MKNKEYIRVYSTNAKGEETAYLSAAARSGAAQIGAAAAARAFNQTRDNLAAARARNEAIEAYKKASAGYKINRPTEKSLLCGLFSCIKIK